MPSNGLGWADDNGDINFIVQYAIISNSGRINLDNILVIRNTAFTALASVFC
jgi:hypothetical protein